MKDELRKCNKTYYSNDETDKPIEIKGIKPIPKELEPLAVEARKYENAEEFEKAVSNVVARKNQFGGLSNTSFIAKLIKTEKNLSDAHIKGNLGIHQLTDFYNQVEENMNRRLKEGGSRKWQNSF